MPLDNRHARAVKNGRRRAIKDAINFGRLREVGYLGRAAEVRDRWEQVVLNDCA